ncbi:hypothetical protein BTO06_12305 [Tenacibaculum sp. SZ-18]|uniref:hypothetical protein n=1 Tax=Tenacibaculum sp. SZ-18 TaxID=754423 RepID=UPI000C2CF2D0|nr:hypothetical protein [Tenacibaculum sp. SZ-18]AUC15885.1 hypothetical protein BTO06_12305 [Tenacibaculum sp. SZ-18]
MNRILLLILFITSFISFSQDLVDKLNGFRLNQFRDVPLSELKEPLQKKTFDDGFEFELYLIKPDSSAYMIFEYPNWDKNIIWSIQLYGDDENIDPNFKGLKMGMTKESVIKNIGQPSKVTNVGEYGEMLEYDNSNYSFEINKQNRLSSIKIKELYSNFFPKPKAEKIPSFSSLLKKLKGDNQEISEILSPGLEIYKNNETLFFKHSWKNEIENDLSGIYSLIRESILELEKVDTKNLNEYEENMRFSRNQDIKHVLKFKKHKQIQEIVMKWEFGKYLIWEIKLK